MNDEQTLRRVIREELERIERIRSGDRWVDGCGICGVPTHGTRTSCQYAILGVRCTDGGPHRVKETFTPDDPIHWKRRDFKCDKCGNYGYEERFTQRRSIE